MSFDLTHIIEDEVVVLSLKGYLERVAGDKLKELVMKRLSAGFRSFILDFSGLELINSQGLASLLESAGQVIEEHEGTMSCFGCDKQTQAVLEMASFFYLAPEAENLEGAKSLL